MWVLFYFTNLQIIISEMLFSIDYIFINSTETYKHKHHMLMQIFKRIKGKASGMEVHG